MKRLATLSLGLLLIAAQFIAVPTARAADLGRIFSHVFEQLPTGDSGRRLSSCIPNQTVSLPGAYGGSATVVGDACLSGSSVTMDAAMTYATYGIAPSITIDGSCNVSVNIVMDLATQTASSVNVVMTGGPITYTIDGENYTISFDNFTVQYTDSLTPVSASGGVTVNGVYYPASVELAAFII